MKKILPQIHWYSLLAIFAWLALAVINPTVQFLTLSLFSGNFYVYKEVATVNLTENTNIKSVKIFKRKGKPFLIVGPYDFPYSGKDFFFISPDCVITTAIEMGSDWCIIGPFLILNDDLTNDQEVFRTSWGLYTQKNDGKITSNGSNSIYNFTIIQEDGKEKSITLSIPDKYFTNDMPNAEKYLKR